MCVCVCVRLIVYASKKKTMGVCVCFCLHVCCGDHVCEFVWGCELKMPLPENMCECSVFVCVCARVALCGCL